MQTHDLGEFNRILDQLGLVFGKTIDDAIRRVYWDALKPLSLKTVRDAATDHMAKGKFFPKPAELRPKFEKSDDGKYPAVGSPDWWDLRVTTLRNAFPRGLSAQSRASLDAATFGSDAPIELLRQSADAYDRAWPQVDRTTYPEAQR